jgi:hypothetical protein
LVKIVLLVPHLLALVALIGMVAVLQLVLWIPIVSRGSYPLKAHAVVAGTLRWLIRVEAYLLGLTDQYPPFRLGEGSGSSDTYPVRVTIARQQEYNRAWALPLVGLVTKAVLLIPHFIILRILQLVTVALQLVLWIPVLFGGRYPAWGYQLVGGYLRWSARVFSYLFGLTDRYPPFQLGWRTLERSPSESQRGIFIA